VIYIRYLYMPSRLVLAWQVIKRVLVLERCAIVYRGRPN